MYSWLPVNTLTNEREHVHADKRRANPRRVFIKRSLGRLFVCIGCLSSILYANSMATKYFAPPRFAAIRVVRRGPSVPLIFNTTVQTWYAYELKMTSNVNESLYTPLKCPCRNTTSSTTSHTSSMTLRSRKFVNLMGPEVTDSVDMVKRQDGWHLLVATSSIDNIISGQPVALKAVKLHVPDGFHDGCADPFILNGVVTCEMFRKSEQVAVKDSKGVIGMGNIEHARGDFILKLKVAIEEDYHLSFPYSFIENDVFYVSPDANGHRQHLFRGRPTTARLGLIYNCMKVPCHRVGQIVPAHASEFVDPVFFQYGASIIYSAFPAARASNRDKKDGRHSKTWNSNDSHVLQSNFSRSCFPKISCRFQKTGQSAGRLEKQVPTQYNPQFYGQYIDLFSAETLDYIVTLSIAEKSGYCGVHHISQDPFSSYIILDAQGCS